MDGFGSDAAGFGFRVAFWEFSGLLVWFGFAALLWFGVVVCLSCCGFCGMYNIQPWGDSLVWGFGVRLIVGGLPLMLVLCDLVCGVAFAGCGC